jgi:L-tyrosine isonitrile synthase
MTMNSSATLADDFDPWYVMLSPPEVLSSPTSKFEVFDTNLPFVEDELSYDAVVTEAEQNARRYIRERWNTVKSLKPAEQLTSLLTSKHYRSGRLTGIEDGRASFLRATKRALAAGIPIEFALPSFPFKVPNPAKVQHRVADYAEVLCLQRLYEITEVTREIANTEGVFHIISDGAIYAGICGVSHLEQHQYFSDIKTAIDNMSASHALHFVDMIDEVLADKIDDFWREFDTITPLLRRWWDVNRKADKIRYLIGNMAANLDLGPELAALTRAHINNGYFMTGDDHNGGQHTVDEFVKLVYDRADKAAFQFTALLTSLRRVNAVAERYPDAVRATVHPKEGQWGIHLVNKESRTFPWQGVALRTNTGAWRVLPHCVAAQRASTLVVDRSTKRPLYYSEGRLDSTPQRTSDAIYDSYTTECTCINYHDRWRIYF